MFLDVQQIAAGESWNSRHYWWTYNNKTGAGPDTEWADKRDEIQVLFLLSLVKYLSYN